MRASSVVKFDPSAGTRVAMESLPDRVAEVINRPDPLRRLIPIPHSANLSCMGKCVRLETNDPAILEHLEDLFSIYPASTDQPVLFRWRIISEALPEGTPFSLARFAFSDSQLRYAEFGQNNFIAIDIDSRLAVVLVSEKLARDRSSLTYPFLDTLFCMCAATLGFTSLFANCIEVQGKAVLLLGPSRTGKTALSYLAAKRGMRWHADDGVFLEKNDGTLRAWGGFWPALMREETLDFFPEIRTLAESFSYGDFVFRRLERCSLGFQSLHAPVEPRCCVFLNRNAGEAVRVARLPLQDFRKRLVESLLFKEDLHFEQQQNDVLEVLTELPAYEISHAGDPAPVMSVIRALDTSSIDTA